MLLSQIISKGAIENAVDFLKQALVINQPPNKDAILRQLESLKSDDFNIDNKVKTVEQAEGLKEILFIILPKKLAECDFQTIKIALNTFSKYSISIAHEKPLAEFANFFSLYMRHFCFEAGKMFLSADDPESAITYLKYLVSNYIYDDKEHDLYYKACEKYVEKKFMNIVANGTNSDSDSDEYDSSSEYDTDGELITPRAFLGTDMLDLVPREDITIPTAIKVATATFEEILGVTLI